MNYFLFNKASDFERGIREQVVWEQGALRLEDPRGGERGIFLSRILDSLEPQTRWHRLRASLSLPANTLVELLIYGTDEDGEKEAVQELLRRPELTAGEKLDKMERFLKYRLINQGDSLLNQVTGRYLWLAVLLRGSGAESPLLSELQLFFPWESLSAFLPELYGGEPGGFLERYLAIFQTIYQDVEQKIREFPALLDLEAADDEALLWLAGWLSMDHLHSWPCGSLKKYLKNGAAVYGGRGTKRGIKHMVGHYTGYRPYLIEPEERPGRFLLLIAQKAVPSYQEYQALLRIVNEVKPAHAEARLVVLRPRVSLDGGSYLGINSVVQGHPPAVLGQMSQLGYGRLGE